VPGRIRLAAALGGGKEGLDSTMVNGADEAGQ
jgi:hypothetical protein